MIQGFVIPNHEPLKIGTLSVILTDIADHLHLEKADLLAQLIARRG